MSARDIIELVFAAVAFGFSMGLASHDLLFRLHEKGNPDRKDGE